VDMSCSSGIDGLYDSPLQVCGNIECNDPAIAAWNLSPNMFPDFWFLLMEYPDRSV
jgi:hypothetical protein